MLLVTHPPLASMHCLNACLCLHCVRGLLPGLLSGYCEPSNAGGAEHQVGAKGQGQRTGVLTLTCAEGKDVVRSVSCVSSAKWLYEFGMLKTNAACSCVAAHAVIR